MKYLLIAIILISCAPRTICVERAMYDINPGMVAVVGQINGVWHVEAAQLQYLRKVRWDGPVTVYPHDVFRTAAERHPGLTKSQLDVYQAVWNVK